MKVTDRLQHASAATSFFAGLALAILPTSAFGQIVTTSQPYDPVDTEAVSNPVVEKTAESSLNRLSPTEIDSKLLLARQAIAGGNSPLAQQHLTEIESSGLSKGSLGDSLPVVKQLINTQAELLELYQRKDPAYNVKAANFLLTQANALLKYRDFSNVKSLIEQAEGFPIAPGELLITPETLKLALASAKSGGIADTGAPSAAVKSVLNLMSKAQLAFDQGNLQLAKSLTEQAKAFDVSDAELPSNQVLPWQLELKIQEAEVAANQFNGNSGNPTVVQAAYDPATDVTKNVQVAGVEPSSEPGSAQQSFDAAMAALKSNDLSAARSNFELAWQNRTELSGVMQQIVQNQLSTLPGGNAPDSDPTNVLLSDSDNGQKIQALQQEVFRQRSRAQRMVEKDPREALELLALTRGRISQEEGITEAQKKPLFTMVDRGIADLQKYIEDNISTIQLREKNEAVLEDLRESRQQKYNAELKAQQLIEDFNQLMEEKRYAEAKVIVDQVSDLLPGSQIAVQLQENVKFRTNFEIMQQIRADKESTFFDRLADVDRSTISPVSEDIPIVFNDPDRYSQNALRRSKWLEEQQYRNPEERRIWNKLKNERVQGVFRGTLNEAIESLSEQTGTNIIFDNAALAADSVSTSSTIDVPLLQPISMQSALNVILGNSGLTFVVEDEVIKVTTRDAQRRDVKPVTYYVGDLVSPIQNFQNSLNMSFFTPNGPSSGKNSFIGQSGFPQANQSFPNANPTGIASNAFGATNALGQQLPNNALLGNLGGGSTQTGTPTFSTVGPSQLGGITQQDFFPLINLIQTTIDPEGWTDSGTGEGTIQAFVPNLSLIVSQTQEVQDQIQDLLQQLRELNDVQIVVEVRFITLNDDFFERIGIDFDFALNDDNGAALADAGGPAVGTPGGVDVVQPSTVIGQVGEGLFPDDLDVPFTQDFLSATIPPVAFGGFDPGAIANFGFAILSDIEVFFLLQAAKGNTRSNVTVAPTVTMFNGQVANVFDGAFVPFVTSVVPIVGDFAVAQQPIITLLPEGTNMNVHAVVSNDRKSVRMTLVPYFSTITDVQEFTFDGSTTTQALSDDSLIDDLLGVVTGTPPADDVVELETVSDGVTVQLPTLSSTTVNTVVSVPDGGTVLLGGIKNQAETRIERGTPFLSNIPYVSRLFKNVGIGRSTSSLMLMVTPRIIIQEEEEEDQVGTNSRRRN